MSDQKQSLEYRDLIVPLEPFDLLVFQDILLNLINQINLSQDDESKQKSFRILCAVFDSNYVNLTRSAFSKTKCLTKILQEHLRFAHKKGFKIDPFRNVAVRRYCQCLGLNNLFCQRPVRTRRMLCSAHQGFFRERLLCLHKFLLPELSSIAVEFLTGISSNTFFGQINVNNQS